MEAMLGMSLQNTSPVLKVFKPSIFVEGVRPRDRKYFTILYKRLF
jgi:hypothetical protein